MRISFEIDEQDLNKVIEEAIRTEVSRVIAEKAKTVVKVWGFETEIYNKIKDKSKKVVDEQIEAELKNLPEIRNGIREYLRKQIETRLKQSLRKLDAPEVK